MTCTHEKRQSSTTWRPYERRLSGVLQAKLITDERCVSCGDVRVSPSEGTRATRDRAETLATRLDPLRHRKDERDLLRTLLECAEVEDDSCVAPAGAWRLRLERALGGSTLDSLLLRLMEDGLLTIQRSRTPKQYNKVTAILWPSHQHAELCLEMGIKPTTEPDVQAELTAALERLGPNESLAAMAAFWADQLEQLQAGTAAILDATGDQLLTSRAPRYPRVIRATIKIAENQSAGRVQLFDELGIQVTGNTKDLRNDRPILRSICGGSLAGYGIVEPTQLIEIAGPVRFHNADFDLTSRAHPFGLATDLVDKAKIDASSAELVVIENPTSFYYSLRARAFDGAICLLADGRLSAPQRTLISRLVGAGVREVRAWCDIDPAGIMIADDIRNAANGARFNPLLLDVTSFERAPVRRKIVGQNLRYAKTLAGKDAWYSPLAQVVQKSGEWVEQEALHGEVGP